MIDVGQIERRTQQRVVRLFRDTLGYAHLGDWTDRVGNRNVDENLLRKFLREQQGYDEALITRALHLLDKAADDSSKSLYNRNRDVCGLLRYAVKVKPGVGENLVIDEFHHAAAASYRKLIAYFHPKFLLGLTATPERSDGGDLLALCQQNLVYRCDLVDGVRKDLLAPFHYFGVPDDVEARSPPRFPSRKGLPCRTRRLSSPSESQPTTMVPAAVYKIAYFVALCKPSERRTRGW